MSAHPLWPRGFNVGDRCRVYSSKGLAVGGDDGIAGTIVSLGDGDEDGKAVIALDRRDDQFGAGDFLHLFPADDPGGRGTWVRCEMSELDTEPTS